MHTVITKEIPAGTARINCPVCGKLDVPAEIIEKQETMMQNLVIPMGTHTTWWVACSACKARLYSKLSAAGLAGKSPDELVGQVYPYTSFVNQFLAVAAIVLSPPLTAGTILALIAWLVNRKTAGWTRKLSKFAVLASLFFLAALFVGSALRIHRKSFVHRRDEAARPGKGTSSMSRRRRPGTDAGSSRPRRSSRPALVRASSAAANPRAASRGLCLPAGARPRWPPGGCAAASSNPDLDVPAESPPDRLNCCSPIEISNNGRC